MAIILPVKLMLYGFLAKACGSCDTIAPINIHGDTNLGRAQGVS